MLAFGAGCQRSVSIDIGLVVDWEPVDEGRGYAHYTIRNADDEAVNVRCTVVVENDFGNWGTGSIYEQLNPGESASGRIPIDVGGGSFLIDAGRITECESAD